MIENIPDLPSNLRGIRATTAMDAGAYMDQVEAALKDVAPPHRLLLEFADDAGVLAPATTMHPLQLAARRGITLDRCALLHDDTTARRLVSATDAVVPFELRSFHHSARQDAIAWLMEQPRPRGIAPVLHPEKRVLVASHEAPMREEDLQLLDRALNDSDYGLVLVSEGLPRWATPGSFFRYLQFLLDARDRGQRVAIVSDRLSTFAGAVIAEHLLDGHVRWFAQRELEQASLWAAAQERAMRPAATIDPIEEAGRESFPASDAPNHTDPRVQDLH